MGKEQLLVGRVFADAARAVPDRVAAVMAGRDLTFGEVQSQARTLAAGLADRGVGAGDRVGVWAQVSLDLVPLFAAVAQMGAVFVPFDPKASAQEVQRGLDRVPVRRLLVDDSHAEAAASDLVRAPAVDTLASLFALDQRAGDTVQRAGDTVDPTDGPERPTPPMTESDPQVVFLTSGSTGESKGVVLSHRTQWLRSTAGPLPEDRGTTVCMFPLFHMSGWVVALQCWQARSPVVFLAQADAESILSATEQHGAERFYAIPAVWRRVLEADPDGRRGASLRMIDTGTSSTPPELLDELTRRYPAATRRVFYGSSEAGAVFMLDGDDVDAHPGAVGRPLPGVEVRASTDGELEVRGLCLFDGYLADDGRSVDPARTTDGWYRTGDLAEQDGDGCWSIVGRSRQVIRTGGESVAPPEVEEVLDAVPGVVESAVVGLADPDWGEIVVAVVVPEGPDPELEQRMADACAAALSSHKRPRRYEFTDSLPRTSATGQVRRSLLVERLMSGLPVDGGGTGP